MDKEYALFSVDKAVEFLGIDSPTGFTNAAIDWVKKEFDALGYKTEQTVKGGLVVPLNGGDEIGVLLEAHADTLGGMVSCIKPNGRLRITPLGALNANNTETENVHIYTRNGKVYEGTMQLVNASAHVNANFVKTERSFDTTEIVIDEDVNSAQDTRDLGIEVGDLVCFDPRARVTKSGYIKSRFLDDKLLVGVLLGLAKYIKDNTPNAKIVFIGPCTAKKAEAQLDEVKPYIDAVMTFEELQALYDSKDIDITTLGEDVLDNASYFGRIFARSGGLSDAVAQGLKEQNIDFDLKAVPCDGIEACRMALLKLNKGILDGNFIEGMACIGGCIGGAGCLTHGEKNKAEVDKYGREAFEKTIGDAVSQLK